MKRLFSFLLSLCLLPVLSCHAVADKEAKKYTPLIDSLSPGAKVNIEKDKITKDFQSWYTYHYYNIHLAQDFTGLSVDSSGINKQQFLAELATGNYVAFKIFTSGHTPVYKLYELHTADADIPATLKQEAAQEISNDAMEGKKLPDFSFIDVNGNVYNKANTKGKILVLKCWFIHCVACVAEFPKLNKLVNDYRQNKEVLFISLARDSQPDLIAFLKTKKFNYAVVPEQTTYMDKLSINTFPTHILIDANGKIVKMTNDIDDLIPAIKKEIAKTN